METRVIDEEEKEEAKAHPLWRRKAVLSVGIIVILAVIAAVYTGTSYFRPPLNGSGFNPEKMAFPTAGNKPSIAVLPFDEHERNDP